MVVQIIGFLPRFYDLRFIRGSSRFAAIFLLVRKSPGMQIANSTTAHTVPGVAPGAVPPAANQQNNSSQEDVVREQMVRARLGAFSGLYFALRSKHPPSAMHGLRVALGCSKWAAWRQMPMHERELLEVAALLHDVGKIGVPDQILQKPEGLNDQELLVMDMNVSVGTELLGGAGASEELLSIVRGIRGGVDQADCRSVAGRMLAIVDAFDSMTTPQVFRVALDRKKAIEELCSSTNRRFDPELVQDFIAFLSQPSKDLEHEVATRWLCQLSPQEIPGFGQASRPTACGAVQNLVDTIFHDKLLDAISDAVIYLDSAGQILSWNRAAERFSGHRAETIIHRKWSVDLMRLTSDSGGDVAPSDCPFANVVTGRSQYQSRYMIRHSEDISYTVHVTGLPVFTAKNELSGVILLVRDASTQASLEQRVQTLHAIATKDTLTKVANRSELTRRLPEFVQTHLQSGNPGALLICDIDYFKRINDTHGHQAGDDALVTFAAILEESARSDDFVARFGGEEFVMLCGGCDIANAIAKAEDIRRIVEKTPIPALKGKTMTASFGVTELQIGDTEETLLARADRALLFAKESGRNRVEQAGNLEAAESSPTADRIELDASSKGDWMTWLRGSQEPILNAALLAAVPRDVAIQKLSGFIADYDADIVTSSEEIISIKIDSSKRKTARRSGERPSMLLMDIEMQSVQICTPGRQKTYQNRERFHVTIRPVKSRDRRSAALVGQADQVLKTLQAYLVAQEITEELQASIIEPR